MLRFMHCINCQYHVGRRPQQEVWVFGLADTSFQPAKGYMQVVDSRDANTLLRLITAHTLPRTIIHSDQWASYRQIAGRVPHVAQHDTVNHSLNFVDPTTGAHTQNIENYWGREKKRFKSMKGVHAHQLPSYLDKYMWRERYGADPTTAFSSILQDISIQYPL